MGVTSSNIFIPVMGLGSPYKTAPFRTSKKNCTINSALEGYVECNPSFLLIYLSGNDEKHYEDVEERGSGGGT